MKKMLFILSALIIISCNDSATTEAYPEDATVSGDSLLPDSMFNNNDQVEVQIRGIGVINRGDESITFFEAGNQEKTLEPGESCDYEILNNSAIIQISGQDDQWGLERQKRYQLIIDSSGRWDIEQIP